ncbi:MAG TPA: glycosyltransferase family A protein [Phycisphaerales bacterium]|nr:glycosyltransferase family A protein [Phycisphaerales bacterium]
MSPPRRYVLISPCRDEARYMRRTLDSVMAQSVLPDLWVIVDDGSTDETPRILEEYAARFPRLRIVRRADRGGRSVGPGVIDAFYAGLETVDLSRFEYLCKLDLDLDLPPGYFELLMRRMEAEPRLGTCSGKAYFPGPANPGKTWEGELVSEGCGDEMSVGMTKFYRTECFRQIGGFVRGVMWDGIDCHRCRMLGWMAASWDEPDLRFIHLRPMGSSQVGLLTGRMRHGAGQWFMGTSLAYMTASALFRLAHPPLVIGGMAMWWGYVRAMLRRAPRYEEPGFRRFLRRYQWRALWRGKRAATAELDRQQAPVWRGATRADAPGPAVPA